MAEKYMLKAAERTQQELSPPRITSEELQAAPLHEAPALYRQRLLEIVDRTARSEAANDGRKREPVISIPEIEQNAIGNIELKNCYSAAVVGSAMQGKTSLVNSVLGVFGYFYENGKVVYPDMDLLPTERGDGCGLPFPVRLEYGEKYSLDMKVWEIDELKIIMKAVAQQKDGDFWNDPEFRQPPAEKSFLQFVCDHGDMKGGNYVVRRDTAQPVLDSLETCWSSHEVTDMEKHIALFQYLKSLVQQKWFGYKQITLRCPSVLLKRMQASHDFKHIGILDLPAVQICDDNNGYVEEVVFRLVQDADSIIVLTGERSLTSDVLEILRRSVFERILDPNKDPPAVALMNSSNLRGLQATEMDDWRSITLLGQMGWNKEVMCFASSEFKQRQHRVVENVSPQLFPNDLTKLVSHLIQQSKRLRCDQHLEKLPTTSTYPGVSALIGYLMWLPQESMLAGLQYILDRAEAITAMVDHLWQVDNVALDLLSPSLGAKEARRLREEEFAKALDAKLTTASRKKMFAFKDNELEEVGLMFSHQWENLAGKLRRLKNFREQKEKSPGLLRSALKEVASIWDNKVGQTAFQRFLAAGQGLASEVLDDWVNKAFMSSARRDQSVAGSVSDAAAAVCMARDSLRKHLLDAVTVRINDIRFKYTFTDSFRQQVTNLDVGDVLKAETTKGQVPVTLATLEPVLSNLFFSKQKPFAAQVEKHIKMQSNSTKQLVALLKSEIQKGFQEYMKNFVMRQKTGS